MGTRKDIIVLDNGGATIKAGFAGDDQPVWCVVAPSSHLRTTHNLSLSHFVFIIIPHINPKCGAQLLRGIFLTHTYKHSLSLSPIPPTHRRHTRTNQRHKKNITAWCRTAWPSPRVRRGRTCVTRFTTSRTSPASTCADPSTAGTSSTGTCKKKSGKAGCYIQSF